MDLDFEEKRVFKVSMVPYIDKIKADFPDEITSAVPSPHHDSIFKVRDEKDAK